MQTGQTFRSSGDFTSIQCPEGTSLPFTCPRIIHGLAAHSAAAEVSPEDLLEMQSLSPLPRSNGAESAF